MRFLKSFIIGDNCPLHCIVMMKLDVKLFVLLLTCVLVMHSDSDRSGNPLQEFFSRLECFKFEQEGCNEDFIDAYPELSRGFQNQSEARSKFYMFTPENVDDPELMHKCGGGLPENTKFNPKCRTMLIFPGFFSGICINGIFREIIYQRFKCGCYNIIQIDWTWGNSFDVVTSGKNVKIVAKQVAVVIRKLKERFGLNSTDFICVGHSVGAHGCALAAQDEAIAVIHGLDPSGPIVWEGVPLNERLDPGDAPCVVSTHCSYGQCLPTYFGANYTTGKEDFFYNDGKNQPACNKQTLISFLTGDIIHALVSLIPGACNHFQCLFYYKTTICSPDCEWIGVQCNKTEDFLSGKCNDCGMTGENCSRLNMDTDCNCQSKNKVKYYMKAGINCPYCVDSGIKNTDKLQCKTVV